MPASIFSETELASALSGKFTPLLRASFRRQLCCATSKYSQHCCVARLTDDENPSRINDTNFPDSTLAETERQLREQHAAKKKERGLIHKKIRIGYGVCGGSPVF